MPPLVQIGGAALNCLVRDGLRAWGRHDRLDDALQEVLVDAALLVQEPQRGFEAMSDRIALSMREPLVINAAKSIHHSDVSGLGQKRGVIDESPERQQIV